MEGPLVSIITPVLNRIETIEASLASVSNQTYRPIEHIVVDGGSTDGTLEFVRKYRSPHPFHWISEPDNGMYEAINKGLSLARGEVLAYLNSDDSIPMVGRCCRSRAAARVRLVYGDLGILTEEANGAAGAFAIQFYPEFDLRHYSFVSTLGQPTVFWRRSLTERIGPFDTRYRLLGDCEYWLRAAINGAKPRHIPEVLAVQVEHGSTLRATQAPTLRKEFDILRRAMRAVIDPPASLEWERLKRSVDGGLGSWSSSTR